MDGNAKIPHVQSRLCEAGKVITVSKEILRQKAMVFPFDSMEYCEEIKLYGLCWKSWRFKRILGKCMKNLIRFMDKYEEGD